GERVAGGEAEGRGGLPPWAVHAVLFVLGFSLVFVVLGASASALGHLLLRHQSLVQKVAGLLVILFGLQTVGLLRLPFLERDYRYQASGKGAASRRPDWQAFVEGMAFAGGWDTCVGPILGSILMLAATTETLLQGVLLLILYSAGMGLPFLGFAFFLGRMERVLAFFRRHYRAVQLSNGTLLLVLGVMLYTNAFTRLAQFGGFFY